MTENYLSQIENIALDDYLSTYQWAYDLAANINVNFSENAASNPISTLDYVALQINDNFAWHTFDVNPIAVHCKNGNTVDCRMLSLITKYVLDQNMPSLKTRLYFKNQNRHIRIVSSNLKPEGTFIHAKVDYLMPEDQPTFIRTPPKMIVQPDSKIALCEGYTHVPDSITGPDLLLLLDVMRIAIKNKEAASILLPKYFPQYPELFNAV